MSIHHTLGRLAGKPLRLALRQSGVALYHLGLAKRVINLTPHRVRTLLYHAVEQHPSSYVEGLNVNVTPAVFALHMDYVKQHYTVEAVQNITSGHVGLCPLAITFDDGYASVEQHALPILQERGLPATVYLIGKAVEGGMVWVNQLNHALNTRPVETRNILSEYLAVDGLNHGETIRRVQTSLTPEKIDSLIDRLQQELGCDTQQPKVFSTPEDIRSMQSQGISFGFHTQDHYNLELCDAATLKKQLDRGTVGPLMNTNTFAYPFGYYSTEALENLEEQGYELLMTVGLGNRRSSALHQDRSEIFSVTAADMFAKLEVEEPVMSALRRHLGRLKRGVTELRSAARQSQVDVTTAHNQSHNSVKTDVPETSKPR